VSQKELARLYRRQAYQRAKAYRAADPKYAQLKEVAKLRRRELYQQIKQTRKAAALVDKAANKAARTAQRTEERAATRRELRNAVQGGQKNGLNRGLSRGLSSGIGKGRDGSVRHASAWDGGITEGADGAEGVGADDGVEETGQRSAGGSHSAQRNGNLQSEIQVALQNKRVSELLARVRLAGEQPHVIANEACSAGEVVPLSRSRRAKEGSPG
jgi:hypothetical protein